LLVAAQVAAIAEQIKAEVVQVLADFFITRLIQYLQVQVILLLWD
jgi:hypothetical protein